MGILTWISSKENSLEERIRNGVVMLATFMLIFYGLVFELGIRLTENSHGERTLAAEAPYYIQHFTADKNGQQYINPLIRIYQHYGLLPENIRQSLHKDVTGVTTVHLDHEVEEEYTVFVQSLPTGKPGVYVVKAMDETELKDTELILAEMILLGVGLMFFVVMLIFIRRSIHFLLKPLHQMVKQLNNQALDNSQPIQVEDPVSTELRNTLDAVNGYRSSLDNAVQREKAFTRYVSHELRTPMMVVRASLSLLRQIPHEGVERQEKRIQLALDDMENLTNVLLLLARKEKIDTQLLPSIRTISVNKSLTFSI